jgi:hypothetical protein
MLPHDRTKEMGMTEGEISTSNKFSYFGEGQGGVEQAGQEDP